MAQLFATEIYTTIWTLPLGCEKELFTARIVFKKHRPERLIPVPGDVQG